MPTTNTGHRYIAEHAADAAARAEASALLQWLLPIIKTRGGAAGFDVASAAMQVFGGAGYTREWPVEQGVRDARVLTILEGTTGMQAQDLLHRRLLRGDRLGYAVFMREARNVAKALAYDEGVGLAQCLDRLTEAAETLQGYPAGSRDADAGATAFLELAGFAATAWIAGRFAMLDGCDPATRRLVAAGRYRLHDAPERAAFFKSQALAGSTALNMIKDIRPC